MEDLDESRLAYIATKKGPIIKTVYIAGPLTPTSTTQNHAIEYLINMRNMVSAGRKLLMAGYYPFVPAFDFLFFMLPPEDGKYCEGEIEISSAKIKDYSMEWLRRCDAILLLPGWLRSAGSVAEFNEALALEIPIFFSIDGLRLEVPNAVS